MALGAVALALLLTFARLDEIASTIASASGVALTVGMLLNLATRFAAAGRTYVLSRAARLPVTFARTLQALYISNFWSLALPGVSAGSVSTVHRYTRHGAGLAESVAVLCASRLVELVVFCVLALAGLATSFDGPQGSRSWAATVLLGVIATVAVALLLLHRLPLTPAKPGTTPSTWRRARAAVVEAMALLRGLSRRSLLEASGWALLQGLLDALTVLALARALGIVIDLPHALWINALSYLAILLPVSTAGLGVREAAVLAALVPLGVSISTALSVALLMLAATLLNAAIGGLLQFATPRPRVGELAP